MIPKKQSSFKILGTSTFDESDTPGHRRFVIVIQFLAFIGMLIILKEWALPSIALKHISGINLKSLLNFKKGSSP